VADYALALEALRALPTALLVVRDNGVTLLANRRAGAVLERTRAEMEGADVASYLCPISKLLIPAAHDERSARLEVRLPSDRTVIVGFAVSELRQLDGISPGTFYSIVLKDLTEVVRLREERDRLLQIATVHEILPAILHEVKNPLAAIATTAELLFEEAEDPHVRESVHAMLHETRRIKLTLQGIGAVGRKLRSTRYEAVDHAIREAWVVLKPRAEGMGVRARCSVPDMPLLPFDTSVVCAIVFNLVTNAIHACHAGGEIELSARLEDEGRTFTLAVDDTGTGMTPEILSRCRELFYTTKSRGTGIGLALCDRALTEASGSMTIDSALGRGTRITLRVPVIEAPPSATRRGPASQHPQNEVKA
jgi:two-component system nitrogen regulation sensor histidine kinase GlnL